jgi:hypothetical protein
MLARVLGALPDRVSPLNPGVQRATPAGLLGAA